LLGDEVVEYARLKMSWLSS